MNIKSISGRIAFVLAIVLFGFSCESQQEEGDILTGLVAYFPFHGNANDESVNTNNGIVNGASLVSGKDGQADEAYRFTGQGSGISVDPDDNLAISNAITLAAWIKLDPKTRPYLGRIVAKNTVNEYLVFGLFHGTDEYISFQLEDPNGNTTYVKTSDGVVSQNHWSHVVATWDGTVMKIYVDGKQKVAEEKSFSGINPQVSSITIGNDYTMTDITGVSGAIDEVRIYNRALNETDIQTLYHF